jgi:hypothetical protein
MHFWQKYCTTDVAAVTHREGIMGINTAYCCVVDHWLKVVSSIFLNYKDSIFLSVIEKGK